MNCPAPCRRGPLSRRHVGRRPTPPSRVRSSVQPLGPARYPCVNGQATPRAPVSAARRRVSSPHVLSRPRLAAAGSTGLGRGDHWPGALRVAPWDTFCKGPRAIGSTTSPCHCRCLGLCFLFKDKPAFQPRDTSTRMPTATSFTRDRKTWPAVTGRLPTPPPHLVQSSI